VPLIHNVMNTDVVIGVSDHATDTLLACSTPRRAPLSSSSGAESIPRWSPRSTISVSPASAISSRQ